MQLLSEAYLFPNVKLKSMSYLISYSFLSKVVGKDFFQSKSIKFERLFDYYFHKTLKKPNILTINRKKKVKLSQRATYNTSKNFSSMNKCNDISKISIFRLCKD